MNETRLFMEAFPDTFAGTKVRVQLFPLGHFEGHPDGPFDVTKDHLEAALKNFEKTKRALPVDFDHGLDYGKTPEERRAAGWIRELEIADDGMYATFEATDEAAEWIKGGQYRFISPTYSYGFTNKETGEDQGFTLLRAGLTNTPFFDGMAPCVAMNEHAKAVMVRTQSEHAEELVRLRDEVRALKAENNRLRPKATVEVESNYEVSLRRNIARAMASFGGM